LYALEASRDYDPSPELEKIKAPLLAINSADDFVNPPELGIMEKLMPRVPHGRYVLIPASEQTHGHGTHTWPEVWLKELATFLAAIDVKAAASRRTPKPTSDPLGLYLRRRGT